MKQFKYAYIITFLIGFAVSAFAQNEFKIIVNADNSIESLSEKELSRIFLKKQNEWSDGSQIIPVDQNSNSNVRIHFSENIHQKNVPAIMVYWQKQIFSGRAVPPAEKRSDRDVITFVKENPGAIGYVSAKMHLDGVKEINVTK
jgi:ABC-type phosphate transport system substrate-binding protein